jgi:hypothetical protein
VTGTDLVGTNSGTPADWSDGTHGDAVRKGMRRPEPDEWTDGTQAEWEPPQKPGPHRLSGRVPRILTPDQEDKCAQLAAQGWTYKRIGKKLGVSQQTAMRSVRRTLERYHSDNWSDLRVFVAKESQKLDRLLAVYMPKALSGDKEATVLVLRIHQAFVRLAIAGGYTAPKRSKITVEVSNRLDGEIDKLMNQFTAAEDEARLQLGPAYRTDAEEREEADDLEYSSD